MTGRWAGALVAMVGLSFAVLVPESEASGCARNTPLLVCGPSTEDPNVLEVFMTVEGSPGACRRDGGGVETTPTRRPPPGQSRPRPSSVRVLLRDPIEQLAWPDDIRELNNRGTYFCFDYPRIGGALPFPWEEVATISVARSRSRASETQVVVGRRSGT